MLLMQTGPAAAQGQRTMSLQGLAEGCAARAALGGISPPHKVGTGSVLCKGALESCLRQNDIIFASVVLFFPQQIQSVLGSCCPVLSLQAFFSLNDAIWFIIYLSGYF